MAVQCGIVGLPNVGKSTLFNALTASGIPAENYPFCTIEPNVGIVEVADPRLGELAKIVNPQKVLAATVEFVDIAGLVEGAAQGEGLGNKFLSHIRETDAIAHVVRCFEDENVVHVSGGVDPLRDIDVIDTELALADLETVIKALDKVKRKANSGDKDAKKQAELLTLIQAQLDEAKPVRTMNIDDSHAVYLRELHLITSKPIMYVANVDEAGLAGNAFVESVKARAAEVGAGIVVVCAAIESEIAELDADDKSAFLDDLGLDEPGLDRVARAAYSLLGLQTYFTAGVQEVRAWTVKTGSTAPQAAGVIHTDFEKGFIRAEVIAYDDFVSLGGENKAKETGKMRLEGKDYIVNEGDVMHFRFNV